MEKNRKSKGSEYLKGIPNIKASIDDDDDEKSSYSSSNKKTDSKSKTPVLDTYSRDLTKMAEEGKLDPIVGREKEIERVSQILSRRKKNNPILIGEPGVGKSSVAEGLALRIIQRKVSRILFNKRVVMLDLASMVAGTNTVVSLRKESKLLWEKWRKIQMLFYSLMRFIQ